MVYFFNNVWVSLLFCIGGIFLFEILLAVLTAGVGSAVSAASKSKYLVKASKALTGIADILKRKRLSIKKPHAASLAQPKAIAKIDKPKTELRPLPNYTQVLKFTDEDHARVLINNLPDDIRGNYRVYTRDGKVVVSRIKAADSPQFRIENGSLVPVSNKIDIFNTIKQKLKINHQDLPLADQKKLKSLEQARNNAVAARDKALLISNEAQRKAALTKAQTAMRTASEALGEEAGRIYVKQNYPDATSLKANLLNKSKQGQFDQIYQTKDGKLIFIEAKGGNASWGARKAGKLQAQQGSKEYMESIIENYNDVYESALANPNIDKSSTEFAALKKTIKALKKANKSKAFEYIGVKQKATDAGIKDAIDIFKFDI